MTDLQQYTGLLDVQTGEILPATVGNAARVLNAARAMKAHIDGIVRETTSYLVGLSEQQGIQTLHGDGETITLSGGATVDYDPSDLMEALEAAGCPQDRIAAAVKTTVTYKVDRNVLRQLAGASEDYKAAIELAEKTVEKRYQATVTLRRNTDAE